LVIQSGLPADAAVDAVMFLTIHDVTNLRDAEAALFGGAILDFLISWYEESGGVMLTETETMQALAMNEEDFLLGAHWMERSGYELFLD